MTNIKGSSNFSLSNLKSVTDKLNKTKVAIPHDKFIYSQYWCYPEINQLPPEYMELAEIFADVSFCLKNGSHHLIPNKAERWVANFIGEGYFKLVSSQGTLYSDHFEILEYNKIVHVMYSKDTVYVYPDNKVMVIKNKTTAEKLRKIRGNDE